MNWLDVAILFIFFATILAGFLRGALVEVISLGSIIAGYMLASKGFGYLAQYLRRLFGSSDAAQITSFIIICLLSIAILSSIGRAVKGSLKTAGMGLFDRTLGAAVGFAKGALYVSFLIIFTVLLITGGNEVIKHSRMVPIFSNVAELAYSFLPKEMKNALGEKLDFAAKKLSKVGH